MIYLNIIKVYKKASWHVTLHTPAPKSNRPTGHFHVDERSITIAYKNTPIFTDPGTGIYTGNPNIRNRLRSVVSHSTFYAPQFANKPEPNLASLFELKQNTEAKQLTLKRIIKELSPKKLIIEDSWLWRPKSHKKQLELQWNFLLHPKISGKKIDSLWLLQGGSEKFSLKTNLNLTKKHSLFSNGYRSVESCKKLTANLIIDPGTGSVQTQICVSSQSILTQF